MGRRAAAAVPAAVSINEPSLHLFGFNASAPGGKQRLMVFTNAAEVELFADGQSAGRKAVPAHLHQEFELPSFGAGNLTAVGYNSTDASAPPLVATTLLTAGAPVALRVSFELGQASLAALNSFRP